MDPSFSQTDPDQPPPLPPEVQGRRVRRGDGTYTFAVSTRDAARLLGETEQKVLRYIKDGRVDVCRNPETQERMVLADSLWLLVPKELRG